MSLYRHPVDDVVYTWEINPFDHINEDCIFSPEYQFYALNEGFWHVVLYPRKNVNGKEYVQLGLRNIPVHTGPQDCTIRYRFAVIIKGMALKTLIGPRRGEFPAENDVGHSVICRDAIFEKARSVEPVALTIRCYLRNLRREKHLRNLTLNARTEIMTQKIVEVLEVSRTTEHIRKEITMGKRFSRDMFEPMSLVNIVVTSTRDNDWFVIYIMSSRRAERFAINCCVSLLNVRGNVFRKTEKKAILMLHPNEERQLPPLVNKKDLDNTRNDLLDDKDLFILHFDLEIALGDYNHEQDVSATSRLHLPGCNFTLGEELGKAFESGKSSDLALTVDEDRGPPDQIPIKVHRCILVSRSPYFKAMLEGNLREKDSNEICLSEVDYYVLHKVLRFLYTDDVDFVDKETDSDGDYREVMDVYRAADMYMVPQLRADCSLFLQEHISKENVVELKDFVSCYSDEDLSEAIDKFVNKWKLHHLVNLRSAGRSRTRKSSSTRGKKE